MTRSIWLGTGLGVFVFVWVAGSGCRKEATPSGSGAESVPAAGTAKAAASVSSCGYTTADAASFLGAPAESITEKSEQVTPTLLVCAFMPRGGAEGVSFSLGTEESAQVAAAGYERLKENILTAAEHQPAVETNPGDSALIEIFGLGDEALWTNTNGALTVRRGALTLIVMAPRDRRQQIKIAQTILPRIP